MPKPAVKVWLDDGSGTFSYNVTPYVDLRRGITIARGRQDEFGDVQASTCSLTLDNTDGRFTYGSVSEPIRIDTGILVETSIGALTASRFKGYVNAWPVTWPGGNRYTEVRITASDRLARLTRRKLRSVLESTILQSSPEGYYVLSEGSDATSAGDTSGNGLGALAATQKGTGGTLEFGSGTGPRTDGHSAPTFTPVDYANGVFLTGPLGKTVLSSTSFWIRCAVSTSVVQQQWFVVLLGQVSLYLMTSASGKLQGGGPSAGALCQDTVSLADGLVHDIVYVCDAGTGTSRLYKDGALVASGTYAIPAAPRITTASIGGNASPNYDNADASISHVAFGSGVPSAATIADWYTAGSDGFTVDSSDERITRYAGWAGIPDTDVFAGGGNLASVAHQDTTGMSVLSAMQNVATSEQGLLFISAGGNLTFHPRSHRYAPVIDATLQAHDIGADSMFSLDTQTLINSVTASREGGATQLYEVASSVAKYEQYPTDLSLLVTSDDDALLAASWVANTNAEPTPRLSSVPVDLLTMVDEATATDVMFLELGDAISITGLPAQAPASSVSLFVEGMQEEISTDQWSITFNTSPLNTVWKLQDPISGRIDSTFRLAY